MNSSHRVSKATSRIALSLLAILATATASAAAPDELELPAQPLADSLRAIAAKTQSNVIFDGKLVEGKSAPPLKTKASADEALKQLLEGTGLTFRHLDDKTVTIQKITGNATVSNDRIRLAQGRGQSSARDRRAAAGSVSNEVSELEEVVVTGSQIRGITNSTVPITVLDREYIDSTGYSTTTRLIESLPQNFALTNQSTIAVIPGLTDFRTQGSSLNLRGISEGTTLVLLNGRRIAPGARSTSVDISALPLSAIQQVEILTDGASALYGSDAIGGVVNFILRDDFDGAETRLRSGWADGGVKEYRFTQALGTAWDSGNVMFSGEYYKRDLLMSSDRDFVPKASLIGSLLPRDENYSAVLSGKQSLTDTVKLFTEALYSDRDSYNYSGRTTFGESTDLINRQANATVGVDWQPGGGWQIEVSGSYAKNDLNEDQHQLQGNVNSDFVFASLFESEAAQIKADGALFKLPGGSVRIAIGADWRSESYEDLQRMVSTGLINSQADSEQIVRSAFAETYVPIIGSDNSVTGIHRLEVSLAGRYDDYSSFGHSFDPRVGLMWEPVNGLRMRGSYGTSYKAPNLVDYNEGINLAAAIFNLDQGAPSGVSYQLQAVGIDAQALGPQESESSSIGLEFYPDAAPGLWVALNYYRIRYTDRIDTPPFPEVMLANPAAFSSLVIRDPTAAQVNEVIAAGLRGRGFFAFNPDFTSNTNFTPDSVDVIVDTRRRNLSVVRTNGLDMSLQYEFDAAGSTFSLGFNGTYILELQQQVTSDSATFDSVGTIYNPPDWRVRGFLGWQRPGWAAHLFVNHADSYKDNRATPAAPISSYTTIDTRIAYDFTSRFSSGPLSGLTVAASVQNLLDEDPPRTALRLDLGDQGFDPTNASPLGRLIALEVTKSW